MLDFYLRSLRVDEVTMIMLPAHTNMRSGQTQPPILNETSPEMSSSLSKVGCRVKPSVANWGNDTLLGCSALHIHPLEMEMDGRIMRCSTETFVDLATIYTTFSHPSRPSRDIPAQEAYCISKAKPQN